MSRVQLALNVDDLSRAVAFYRTLLSAEPVKTRPGYANFVAGDPPLKLVLIENHGRGGSINHLGIEVASSDAVRAEAERLAAEGIPAADERGVTCCYAAQDKAWVTAPDGERWEVYTVLHDADTFGEAERQRPNGCDCGPT